MNRLSWRHAVIYTSINLLQKCRRQSRDALKAEQKVITVPSINKAAKTKIYKLFEVFRPTREFFTHMETLPLPVKGCKCWLCSPPGPLSSEGSLACPTYCDTGHPFITLSNLRGPMKLTAFADRYAVELSLPVFTTKVYRLEFRLRGKRSNPLRHRWGS